ncbi:MAG: OmpA family protein [Alphaproteobacteria bacterium]|nr:OmpA family protein [Alphaproteobacteria bacterium]
MAYADFVTAMMAFFLLLWLLNVTTDEQKNAISNYFDPTHPKVSTAESGAGGVLGGLTMAPKGSMASMQQPVTPPIASRTKPAGSQLSPSQADKNKKNEAKERAKEKKRQEEQKKFDEAAQKIKQAIQQSPELAQLAKNLIIDMTPEGLRIQIVDQDGEPMFPSGSAQMFDKTKQLMEKISEIIKPMPNEISVRGHTDSVPYGPGASYTNWELSADRANASRRVILGSGLPSERLNNVVGKADTEHLFADDPKDARNRRISIILLKEELTNPESYENLEGEELPDDEGMETEAPDAAPAGPPVGTFRRTPGKVEFP